MSIEKNSLCNKILPNPFLLSELIYLSHFASGYPVHQKKLWILWIKFFIGTSNWTEDYYTTTAGVTFVFSPVKKSSTRSSTDLRTQLEEVFFRDFNSPLAQNIT